MERAKVRVPAVPHSGMLDDRTGYIYLSKFTRGSAGEVRKALMALRDSRHGTIGARFARKWGWIAQRECGHRQPIRAEGTGLFRPEARMKRNKSYVALGRPTAPDMPLVVLIDGQSASFGNRERHAARLGPGRHRRDGELKRLAQQTKDMAFNTRLKVTVAKYYTASGRCIQRLDYGGKRDAQGKALAVSDSLLRTFTTAAGRPVIEGRGIQPDIEVETPFMSMLMARLLDEFAVFDYATAVASLDSTDILDPVNYRMGAPIGRIPDPPRRPGI